MIPGKITTDELAELTELAKDRNVIQIGAYCGKATVALASVVKRLWVLDNFAHPGMDAVVNELIRNVKEADVDDKISFLHGDGLAFKPFGDLPFDVTLVYRDANRQPEHEENDQLFAVNALVGGGAYAWHGAAGLKHMGILKKPVLGEVA